jgi:hypothetical protein
MSTAMYTIISNAVALPIAIQGTIGAVEIEDSNFKQTKLSTRYKIATLTMCKVIVTNIEIFVTMLHLIPGERRISGSPGEHAARPTQCAIIEEMRETASFESSSVKF